MKKTCLSENLARKFTPAELVAQSLEKNRALRIEPSAREGFVRLVYAESGAWTGHGGDFSAAEVAAVLTRGADLQAWFEARY